MKMKFFIALVMVMGAFFVHAEESDADLDRIVWTNPPQIRIRVIEMKGNATINDIVPFDLEEDDTNDGYKWYVQIDKKYKNSVKVVYNDTKKQKDDDIFKIKFTKLGKVKFRFVYANMKNRDDVKIIINHEMNVIEAKKENNK